MSRTPARPARVAVVTSDYDGPRVCGGVGSAYRGLVEALIQDGHTVQVAYVARKIDVEDEAFWRRRFAADGVDFTFVPYAEGETDYHWLQGRKEASYLAYQWLKRQDVDVVHFPEWLGLAFYSLLAKRQGLAFDQTTLVVGTHGPLRWSRPGEERLANGLDDLVTDYLERRSVELADVVVSPSRYLLDWAAADRWRLPKQSYVQQNLLSLRPFEDLGRRRDRRRIDELVFFGRLERRKGLDIFLDAVDELHRRGHTPNVTFLGADAHFDNKELSSLKIQRHCASWPNPPQILVGRSREQALRYLLEDGRLAVMPSRIDNSPCTIQECLLLGIPFVASTVGGIPELVSESSRDRVLTPLDSGKLAERLGAILEGGYEGSELALPAEDNQRAWSSWHGQEAASPLRSEPAERRQHCLAEPPLVSLCVAHWQRAELLEQALDSFASQTYPSLEVIVVDDGSDAETSERLRALEPRFEARGWRLESQENAGPGRARNRAAELAAGELLLFADDDDVLRPNAVEEMVRTACVTGADAVTCVLEEFEGRDVPGENTRVLRRLLPLGPALSPGLMAPEFGGTFILMRAEAFRELGGFSEERQVDEDWELLLDAVLAGQQLEVVPEALVWYRKQPGSRSRADNRHHRLRSRLRKYEEALPLELRGIVELAYAHTEILADVYKIARLRDLLQRRHDRAQES